MFSSVRKNKMGKLFTRNGDTQDFRDQSCAPDVRAT